MLKLNLHPIKIVFWFLLKILLDSTYFFKMPIIVS